MTTRPLRGGEIDVLRANGCAAADWRGVAVADGFSPERLSRVEFSGRVTIGADCGIADASLSDVDIGDGVRVRNVAFLGQASPSSFGNGLPVHCVAEDGARSVPLWRCLSAQWAHLILHLKNTPAARALERMIAADAASLPSGRSRVGAGCRIEFSGILRNVLLGPGTVVEGAAGLSDVHADSTAAAPVFIGGGVAAGECVFQQAARVDGGSRLSRCLVGEGVRIGNAFSADHSLFFANSDFGLGESACSVSGPFAVSHHRATLVLACQNSFGNFGSASNSSNHHFKLGPRHGGVLRRGARCGSGSYLLWPSDIGAFSTVVGRHARHLDTSSFPFSLLTQEGGGTLLVPGVNLFSAGLFRDERKWPGRDMRTGVAEPLDLYESAILSPYTMEAVERGLSLLRLHRAAGGGDLCHNGALIPASRVDAGIRLYEAALTYYLGCVLFGSGRPLAELASLPAPAPGIAAGWRDWGGMLVSGARAERFLRGLADGSIPDASAVASALREMHEAYRGDELLWAAGKWREKFGPDAAAFRERWRGTVAFACGRRVKDAEKEFAPSAMYGFGVEADGGEQFRRVRGLPGSDPIVVLMREERDRLLSLAD